MSGNSHYHKSCIACSSCVSALASKVHNESVDMHSNTPLRIPEETQFYQHTCKQLVFLDLFVLEVSQKMFGTCTL